MKKIRFLLVYAIFASLNTINAYSTHNNWSISDEHSRIVKMCSCEIEDLETLVLEEDLMLFAELSKDLTGKDHFLPIAQEKINFFKQNLSILQNIPPEKSNVIITRFIALSSVLCAFSLHIVFYNAQWPARKIARRVYEEVCSSNNIWDAKEQIEELTKASTIEETTENIKKLNCKFATQEQVKRLKSVFTDETKSINLIDTTELEAQIPPQERPLKFLVTLIRLYADATNQYEND
ncbi:hypothetical protein KAW80_03830 [Candidatus Babeliales bacterium]|nr:hypothetical protein [Candidatus Babeliales bacterium]